MCDLKTLSYSCISWGRWLAQFVWNVRTDISDPFEVKGAKENILLLKRKRRLLRNFFVNCEFVSQSYNLFLRNKFANTLFVGSAK